MRSHNSQSSGGSTTPSTLTNTSIQLIQLVGEPDLPEADDPNLFAHSAYCHAIKAIDSDPRKFDTSRPCLVCGLKGHSFDGCPMLNDIEYLRSHRILVANFLKKVQRSDDTYSGEAKISQICAQEAGPDDDEYSTDSSSSPLGHF